METGPEGRGRRGVGRSAGDLLFFFGIYLGSLLFAALLLPAAWDFLQFLARRWTTTPTVRLASYPAGRVFDRLRWLPLAVGVPWLLHRRGLLSWEGLGIRRADVGRCGRFFLLGLGAAALLCAAQLAGGGWTWKPGGLLSAAATALPCALLVALLEEIVLRRLLLHLAVPVFGAPFASLLAALFFAYVHFKAPLSVSSLPAPPTVLGGLRTGWGFLVGIRSSFRAVPFLSLSLLGLLLGNWLLRRRSLLPPIGFHAGLAFALLTYRRAVLFSPGFPSPLLGTADLVDSPLCPLLLGLLLLVFHRHETHRCPRRRPA
jgi:membrane protease YdiL (CAAX protease family)